MGKAQDFLRHALAYKGDDCLSWPFAVLSNGYPQLGVNGKTEYAHRIVCTEVQGPPSKDLQAAHSCGNRRCVNPKHLRWATAHENNGIDKVKQGKLAKGEAHGMSKLSQNQVDQIRASSEAAKIWAERLDVSPSLINKIRQNTIWRKP